MGCAADRVRLTGVSELEKGIIRADAGAAAQVSFTVAAGAIAAVLVVSDVVANAALIYSGPLSPGLLLGASALLAAFALSAFTVALGSGVPGMACSTIGAIIYAGMAGAVDHALARALPDPTLRATAVLLLGGASTVACGIALLLLGSFRLGTLAQLLPYPVIAGYYSGLAWLLAVGGLRVGAGLSIGKLAAERFGDPGTLARLAVCLGVAALLVGLPRWRRHWAVLPLVLLVGGVGFHLARLVLQVGVPEAQAAGWLLGPFPGGATAPLHSLGSLRAVGLDTIAVAAPYAASAVVLTLVTLLLMVGSIELELRRSIDGNHEVTVAGFANLLGGALGGTPCTQSVTTTSLLYRLGGASRTGAAIPGLAALAVMIAGAQVIGLIPRFLVGALLLSFAVERLLVTWRDCLTLPRHETAIVLFVLLATGAFGIVPGLEVGLALALLIFAWNYRRIPVIRPALSGAVCRSSVSRSQRAEAVLREAGDAIVVHRLQGYLFFLNVGGIPAAIGTERPVPTRCIVLDFQDVVGMDSSAHTAFWRCEQIAAKAGAEIVLCGLGASVSAQFRQRGLLRTASAAVRCFDTLDLALQYAEDALLRSAGIELPGIGQSLADHISAMLGEPVQQAELAPYLAPLRLAAGEVLIRQGERDEAMYFIERGRVSIWLERPGSTPVRLASTAAGGLVGEMALYRGGVRSATVIADEPTEVTGLSAAQLARMEWENPRLAGLLQRCLVLQMADKLANNTRLIQMLLR
jgi:SulP family sulfate permease